LMGGGIALAYTIQAGFSLAAASVVIVAWRQNVSLPARAAVLASATLVAIPLALVYDLMLATIAACWLLRTDRKTPLAGWEKLVLAAAYPALLCWRGLIEISPVPIATICALAMFAIATRHAWLELDRASLWRRHAA
jgi:hypothetical protein